MRLGRQARHIFPLKGKKKKTKTNNVLVALWGA